MKCFASFALVLVISLVAFPAEAASPPNILVIFSDDQGVDDVGCYGSEIPTPHLDSLAEAGLKFNQFYAASSICTPSRFGLLTGRFAHRSQDQLTSALMFLAEEHASRGIRRSEVTYASLLRDAGYQTHLVGKWHLGHGDHAFWPTRHGFDTFFGHTGGCVDFFTCHYGNRPDWYRGTKLVETKKYATDVITDEAVSVIRNVQTEKPWYLHVAYNAPHFGKGWNEDQQAPENIMQPKPEDMRRVSSIEDPLRRAFAAKVVGMDDSIGKLMAALEQTGQTDNTLVIFMTDHGGDAKYGGSNRPLRGGKATLFEGGLRVPCLVCWPAVVPKGMEVDAVACALDWFPTFMQLAGVEAPDDLDGESIVPILQGKPSSPHRPIVWSTGAHAELGREAWYAARDGKWKWVQPPGEDGMLFDLETDPNERTDLSGKHPREAEQLRKLIDSTLPPKAAALNFEPIEPLVNAAIEAGDLPGAVVCFADRERLLYSRAFGQRQVEPTPEVMTTDTIFDLASLTKPVATATSVMLLVQQGKLSVADRVTEHLPEFTGKGKDNITVRQCLVHTSGLTPDNSLKDYQQGPETAWRKICDLPLRSEPGEKFSYSDVGFIVLGKLVERLSGRPLNEFAAEKVFEPMGLADTQFLPAESLVDRIAPTEKQDGKFLRGRVHDPRSALLGGVAGHAGLFSTAADLIVYGREMMNALDGESKVFERATLQQMFAPQTLDRGTRALGWDHRSPYSSNRGNAFSDSAVGHGGFTGTVFWIDPEKELLFVFLSSRLHPDGKGKVNQLAGKIATLVAEQR